MTKRKDVLQDGHFAQFCKNVKNNKDKSQIIRLVMLIILGGLMNLINQTEMKITCSPLTQLVH